jgi:hypothetical protein
MKLFITLIESLLFSYVLLLLLVRIYYLLASGVYKRKINKVQRLWLYFMILFIPLLFYNFFLHSQREGADYIKIPLKYDYYIVSNEVGTKLYKGDHLYEDLQSFRPVKYGVNDDLLYGHFISTNKDTARFLLNLRTNDITQFYSDDEYEDYCKKNNLQIIKEYSLAQNSDSSYYWYFKPSALILLILLVVFIIWLRKKEKKVLEG